jgi:DNA-binding transcriptional LysR family regulator
LDVRRQSSVQLRSLRVFCDVVRRRSFSQAAVDNGMTQGAASQAVQHLEDYLDVQLIDRSKRPFVLTSEGEKFYDGVASLLRQFDSLVDQVQVGDEVVSGEVNVGAIYSLGLSYLPAIQERFNSQFSSASCVVKMAHPHDVYRMVEQGAVDFGVLSYPEASRTLLVTHWREEPMVLVASPRHRLCNHSRLSISDLAEVALVAFAPKLPIRLAIDRHLRSLGVSMRVVVELDNVDSVKHAAIVNSGLAFLPKPTIENELAAGSLRLLNCPEVNMTRPLGVIQRRDVPLGRAARGMLELLLQDALQREAVPLANDNSNEGSSKASSPSSPPKAVDGGSTIFAANDKRKSQTAV